MRNAFLAFCAFAMPFGNQLARSLLGRALDDSKATRIVVICDRVTHTRCG